MSSPLVVKTVLLTCLTLLLSPLALAQPKARAWKTLYREDFSRLTLPETDWLPDTYPNDGIYSDRGEYFKKLRITPPLAYRAKGSFGKDGWLTFETYSRSKESKIPELISVQDDPAGKGGKALRVVSPVHTDATLIRPTRALPAEYRVCVEVGYADFGDGKPSPDNLNGYLGGEKSEPWSNYNASQENGFYWLTILDSVPRPHNNVWIHHHRKVVIDSDNNKEGWTNIWTGNSFKASGEHPVMMFALSKEGNDDERIGKPFISFSNDQWHPVGEIKAADAYEDKNWYEACIERTKKEFTLETYGNFRHGGKARHKGTIEADRVYLADAKPDYFMFGDPHNNFYRGTVYYRNVRLEIPAKR